MVRGCSSSGRDGASSVKRDLLQCQKRPTTVSKETRHLEEMERAVSKET